jgi:hypothetical protein
MTSKAFILISKSPRTSSTYCPRFFWDITLTETGRVIKNGEVTGKVYSKLQGD